MLELFLLTSALVFREPSYTKKNRKCVQSQKALRQSTSSQDPFHVTTSLAANKTNFITAIKKQSFVQVNSSAVKLLFATEKQV